MEIPTYPFPLAANSSHHSHYHRFLLGADPAVLAPFPKPYCFGALSRLMPRLTETPNLQTWRKLFHGAIPWVEGFGPDHYGLGAVAPHRPLPRAYGRPLRRFGAYDFVQAADPSVTALALVAGDKRLVNRFTLLTNDFCACLEAGASARNPGPSGSRLTGRMLAGQFVEPNNRWLMPYLHVHTRVLNLTSFKEAPARLACIDSAAMARAAEKAKRNWIAGQAQALSDLGYRVAPCHDGEPALQVEGVSEKLVAAMEAPRIAVMRMLERIVMGDCEPSARRFTAELPPAVIAAMAEQLESIIVRSLSFFKPPKMGIPSEGPWRGAVREHMSLSCPAELVLLDAAAARARAVPLDSAIFPTPQLDPAHFHAPTIEALDARSQLPSDPELGTGAEPGQLEGAASAWLAQEFDETLREVNDRLVQVGPHDALVSLRSILTRTDQLSAGADTDQLAQSASFLAMELDRRAMQIENDDAFGRRAGRVPLASLDELFESQAFAPMSCERELGGRGL